MSVGARTHTPLGRSRKRARPSALSRRLSSLRKSVRDAVGAILHLPRTQTIDGVRYRERNREPLQRVLAPAGEGTKEYDVRFPGADAPPPMTIRFTRTRRYADLASSARLPLYRALDQTIRPGQRVFELGCGAGESAALLASLVGPSGGVVAVGADRESIRYARRRYRSGQLGYEHGGVETLAGELDGSFEAVILTDPPTPTIDDEQARADLLTELWRVVAPAGTLIWCQTASTSRAPSPELVRDWLAETLQGARPKVITPPTGGACVIVSKPEPKPSRSEMPPEAS